MEWQLRCGDSDAIGRCGVTDRIGGENAVVVGFAPRTPVSLNVVMGPAVGTPTVMLVKPVEKLASTARSIRKAE